MIRHGVMFYFLKSKHMASYKLTMT